MDAQMVDRLELWADRLAGWDTPFSLAAGQVAAAQSEVLEAMGLPCPERLRARFLSAVGDVCHTAGYMAFDRGDVRTARAAWSDTLAVAEQAGGALGLSLAHRARASLGRAQLAGFGGVHPQRALEWATGAAGDGLTATEHALAYQVQARAYAVMGNRQAVVRSVGMADEQRGRACPETDPPWVGISGEAEYLGDTGHALADVALANPDMGREEMRAGIREADTRLLRAAGHKQAHQRTRLFSRLAAACVSMRYVDPERAVEIAEPALRLAPLAPSAQARVLIEHLGRACEPHLHRPSVEGLHRGLGGLLR